MSEGDQYIGKRVSELEKANDIKGLMVVGFMFDYKMENVLLIEKNRPAWQKGRLNGIGGKVKKGENEWSAMQREFKEEAGVYVEEWQRICSVSGNDWTVHFFAIANEHYFQIAEQKTDEKLFRVNTNCLREKVINNLRWLIPMAIHDFDSCPYNIAQHDIGDEV